MIALIIKLAILSYVTTSVVSQGYSNSGYFQQLAPFQSSSRAPWNLDFLGDHNDDDSDEDDNSGEVNIIGSTIVHIVSPNEDEDEDDHRSGYQGYPKEGIENVVSGKSVPMAYASNPVYDNLKPVSAYGKHDLTQSGVKEQDKVLDIKPPLNQVYPHGQGHNEPKPNIPSNKPIISFGSKDALSSNPMAPSESNFNKPQPNGLNQFNPNTAGMYNNLASRHTNPNAHNMAIQNPNYGVPPHSPPFNNYNPNHNQGAYPKYNTPSLAPPEHADRNPHPYNPIPTKTINPVNPSSKIVNGALQPMDLNHKYNINQSSNANLTKNYEQNKPVETHNKQDIAINRPQQKNLPAKKKANNLPDQQKISKKQLMKLLSNVYGKQQKGKGRRVKNNRRRKNRKQSRKNLYIDSDESDESSDEDYDRKGDHRRGKDMFFIINSTEENNKKPRFEQHDYDESNSDVSYASYEA